MFFYIKEWPDGTAALMAESGAVLWTFPGVDEAQQVCRDWYQVHKEDVDCYVEGMIEDSRSFDPACASCAVA